jgi:methionine-rich copper-binding protein CopC
MMTRTLTVRAIATTFAAAALLLGSSASRAHAFLDRAEPAVGSTVPSAPGVIHLWFTQQLEPAFSSVTVTDKSGAAVNDGPAQADPSNKSELNVKLKPLPSGTYKVKWRVLSVDTHRTEGDFSFSVRT